MFLRRGLYLPCVLVKGVIVLIHLIAIELITWTSVSESEDE